MGADPRNPRAVRLRRRPRSFELSTPVTARPYERRDPDVRPCSPRCEPPRAPGAARRPGGRKPAVPRGPDARRATGCPARGIPVGRSRERGRGPTGRGPLPRGGELPVRAEPGVGEPASDDDAARGVPHPSGSGGARTGPRVHRTVPVPPSRGCGGWRAVRAGVRASWFRSHASASASASASARARADVGPGRRRLRRAPSRAVRAGVRASWPRPRAGVRVPRRRPRVRVATIGPAGWPAGAARPHRPSGRPC